MANEKLKNGIENDYPRIPLSEIDEEARILAVMWGDEYFEGFALDEKQKLASDFMNYARRVAARNKKETK